MSIGDVQKIPKGKPGSWVAFLENEQLNFGLIGRWENSGTTFLVKVTQKGALRGPDRIFGYTLIDAFVEPIISTMEAAQPVPGSLYCCEQGAFICYGSDCLRPLFINVATGAAAEWVGDHSLSFSGWSLFQSCSSGTRELLTVKL